MYVPTKQHGRAPQETKKGLSMYVRIKQHSGAPQETKTFYPYVYLPKNTWHHTLEHSFQEAYLSAKMHDVPPAKSQTEYSPQ